MSNQGLAEAQKGTTTAPTMYKDIEQDENVARGHVSIIEIIAYDATKEPRRWPPDKDQDIGEIRKDKDGNILYVEISRGPYFCQDPEDALVFEENNPDTRTETFTVQVRKSTAIKYLDAPENMEQFEKQEDNTQPEPIELDWRQQAKELGIKMYQRKKEDVLADIAEQTVLIKNEKKILDPDLIEAITAAVMSVLDSKGGE